MENAKKIRVAFFADILTRDFDGAIKTMYQLIDRIPETEFEYLFFCGVPPTQDLKYPIVTMPAVTIPFNVSYKVVCPYWGKKQWQDALEQFSPDVIHLATPSPLGFFALNYARRQAIPVLAIYHTHFISYMRYYFKYLPFLIRPVEELIKMGYRGFYNQCDLVYVPTSHMTDELEQYGISGKSLKLWQRGLDTKLFNSDKKDEAYIRKLTGNDKPCILYASRLVWEKNIETLFEIYDEVQSRQLDVNFIVVGDGVAGEAARKHMKNAIFLGFLDHAMLAKVYASCEVFLFTSISETYGNVVVEAMASGCIPIIARGGGSQSLVKDGENGFLCEPHQPLSYLSRMMELLDDPGRKQQMQRSGYRFTSTLSWTRLAGVYFNDIEQLAERKFSLSFEPSFSDIYISTAH